MVTLPLPNKITIGRENWVRMMYCMKHLMKLHPEYYDMIKPFYDQMYDKYPYNELDPFDFDDNYKVRPRTNIERELDKLADLNSKEKDLPVGGDDGQEVFNSQLNQLVWDLGLSLPSWDDDHNERNKNDKT